MKADGFRDLSADELDTRVQELREQLLKLRFQKSTGMIENPQTVTSVRKDLARALTVRNERELGIGPEPAPIARRDDDGDAATGSE